MFTGIIESLGTVESVQNVGGDVRLRIGTDLDMSDVHLGDSIATNGICLTVIDWGEHWYAADVSRESLNHTGPLESWTTCKCGKGDVAHHTFWWTHCVRSCRCCG